MPLISPLEVQSHHILLTYQEIFSVVLRKSSGHVLHITCKIVLPNFSSEIVSLRPLSSTVITAKRFKSVQQP